MGTSTTPKIVKRTKRTKNNTHGTNSRGMMMKLVRISIVERENSNGSALEILISIMIVRMKNNEGN